MSRYLCILAIVLQLLGCGQENSQHETSTPPLITAAESGDLATLKQLLQNNSADSYDSCQWTPLMKASLNGHHEVAVELLTARASVDLGDKGGYTALMLAASNNHHTLARLLLENGADINHQESTQGWTALIWSAKRGHLETVKVLMGAGADIRIRDNSGMHAGDWAVKNHHRDIARLLASE